MTYNKGHTSIEVEKKYTKEVPNRIFHHISGKKPGATIVFFAGIHGNEYAGVNALNNVLEVINTKNISGEIFGVYGNIKALKKNKRFLNSDLNRMWTTNQLNALKKKTLLQDEELEQKELFHVLSHLLTKRKNPLYFIDLHTTSSKTLPFITINDALINRKFSRCFPLPIVLGIEEYLEGPLLSYLNTLGFVSLGFEAGQHTDPKAISNCEAFIVLALKHAGILELDNNNQQKQENILKKSCNNIVSVFEVIYKYHIETNEDFKMIKGFESFQDIKKGTLLAASNNTCIYSNYTAKLFMPLYQKSGNDGFFIIRPIPQTILKTSEWLREIKADKILTLLPGITWHNKNKGILKANLKIARFLTKSIFHLFGYRNRQIDKNYLLLYNRERVSKKKMYSKEYWY